MCAFCCPLGVSGPLQSFVHVCVAAWRSFCDARCVCHLVVTHALQCVSVSLFIISCVSLARAYSAFAFLVSHLVGVAGVVWRWLRLLCCCLRLRFRRPTSTCTTRARGRAFRRRTGAVPAGLRFVASATSCGTTVGRVGGGAVWSLLGMVGLICFLVMRGGRSLGFELMWRCRRCRRLRAL